jgi:hypothetical protein
VWKPLFQKGFPQKNTGVKTPVFCFTVNFHRSFRGTRGEILS